MSYDPKTALAELEQLYPYFFRPIPNMPAIRDLIALGFARAYQAGVCDLREHVLTNGHGGGNWRRIVEMYPADVTPASERE